MTKKRSNRIGMIAAAAMLAVPAWTAAQTTQSVQIGEDAGTYPTGTILIQHIDTLWTAAGDPIAGASILIRDGIIREIGTNLSAPNGAEVIDGSGMQAMPGIVDEHSHIAMSATNEFTAPLVPEVRVIDALNTEDLGIFRALSGGVTTARIMHGSSNPIGGQSAVIKARWGMEAAHDLLIPGAPRFVKFALGENVTRKGGSAGLNERRFPASRQGVEAIYVEAFTAGAAYKAEWDRYRDNPRDFRVPPRRDLRLEAIVDIMEGRIQVHAHSYRADEILMLMRVAERFGFRIAAFTHALEGYRVAAEMAEHGAAGSTFSDWWQYKREAFDAIPYNAALMQEAGVLTSINSDIPWLQSFMHLEIAKPVKYGGVSKLNALRMLTLNPATILGVEDKVGSLEVGKQGDVVLLSGSPFSSYSRVEKTIVDGIVYYDLSDEQRKRKDPFRPITDDLISPDAPEATPEAAPTAVDHDPIAGQVMGPIPGEATAQEEITALVGGMVHPVSGPPIANGVVLLEGGFIRAVGSASEVQVPAGARRVDVSGKHIYPGMIDPLTTIGLFEFGQVGQATDTQETGDFNPHVRAIAAVNPYYPSLNVARANGITSVLTHQTSGLVQGTAAVIQFNGGDTYEQVALKQEAALVVAFPAPAKGPTGKDVPELKGGRMDKLVAFFDRAMTYVEAPSVSNDPTAPFEANIWGGDQVVLEAMGPALRGEVPILFKGVNTEWQIKTLFVFLEKYPDVAGVIVGGDQAFKMADQIAESGVPVVITTAYRPTSDQDESITAAYRNAGILYGAGVKIAFATGDDGNVRNLPYHAAHSVAFGLPMDAGLEAVTLNPAEILMINTGSLQEGKRADLIVTDGDPLELLTHIEMMWVGGTEVDPMSNKHTDLYERFRGRTGR
jgi:imidazolonepropionase-like amidohydrolase